MIFNLTEINAGGSGSGNDYFETDTLNDYGWVQGNGLSAVIGILKIISNNDE